MEFELSDGYAGYLARGRLPIEGAPQQVWGFCYVLREAKGDPMPYTAYAR